MSLFIQVEWYLQRAVEIYTSELGSEDPNVAKTMSILVSSLSVCYNEVCYDSTIMLLSLKTKHLCNFTE